MTLSDYMQLALRTYGAGENKDMLSVDPSAPRFVYNLLSHFRQIKTLGERANLLKRYIFYGKLPEGKKAIYLMPVEGAAPKSATEIFQSQRAVDAAHALLGIQSEAAEISEILIDLLEGRITWDEFTFKMKEEYGDTGWYNMLGCATALPGEDAATIIATANIRKLLARYPNKFDPNHAVVRDLNAEMRALANEENGTKGEDQ